jgi:hypothetical protein
VFPADVSSAHSTPHRSRCAGGVTGAAPAARERCPGRGRSVCGAAGAALGEAEDADDRGRPASHQGPGSLSRVASDAPVWVLALPLCNERQQRVPLLSPRQPGAPPRRQHVHACWATRASAEHSTISAQSAPQSCGPHGSCLHAARAGHHPRAPCAVASSARCVWVVTERSHWDCSTLWPQVRRVALWLCGLGCSMREHGCRRCSLLSVAAPAARVRCWRRPTRRSARLLRMGASGECVDVSDERCN